MYFQSQKLNSAKISVMTLLHTQDEMTLLSAFVVKCGEGPSIRERANAFIRDNTISLQNLHSTF